MKKVLITAYSLNIGGIEIALIEMLKNIHNDYDVTLLLREAKGELLEEVPSNVEVLEYKISDSKNPIVRKIKNRTKLMAFIKKYRNKFDASICFAGYDIPGCKITQGVCENSAVWLHTDYSYIYSEDELRAFFDIRSFSNFKHYVFVTNEGRDHTIQYFGDEKDCYVINNLLDIDQIIHSSSEFKAYDELKESKRLVFVGRLEEESKRLSALLEAMSQLDDSYQLSVVGDGPSKEDYLSLVSQLNLNNVTFVGSLKNPYPYIKGSDLLILPSYYEGLAIVMMEALTLHKPVLTSIEVSANDFESNDYVTHVGYGINELVEAIKDDKTYDLKKEFDPIKYNEENLKRLNQLLMKLAREGSGDNDA